MLFFLILPKNWVDPGKIWLLLYLRAITDDLFLTASFTKIPKSYICMLLGFHYFSFLRLGLRLLVKLAVRMQMQSGLFSSIFKRKQGVFSGRLYFRTWYVPRLQKLSLFFPDDVDGSGNEIAKKSFREKECTYDTLKMCQVQIEKQVVYLVFLKTVNWFRNCAWGLGCMMLQKLLQSYE